ncbi:PREDICTED: protein DETOXIFICATION 12-like [Tarenaya hassleriana]|uniref:protein DETOXIFICATION 12-like n=1 Tax=Tarenaya hassleriana TaxID=28532 RepID=UPI00053C352C|nr:PREDICTED: protein DETOXIFICATION 12-like [Tarenaya hassleriana]
MSGEDSSAKERLEAGEERVTWRDLRDGALLEEIKRVGRLAAPMAAVVVLQYALQIISMAMVGHLGQLSLSSTSLATSFCNVTGLSFIIGMSCALDTLSGQAYGAKLYRKLGIQTYTAMFCLALVCIPLSLIWVNISKLLVLVGQDPLISHEAGRYATCLIPALFAYAVLQPLTRYFQNQSLIRPLLISSFIALCVHVPLCWLLVYKSGLRNLGGAVAFSLSIWVNVIILGSFMRYSSACSATRAKLSMEIFHGIGEFFRYAFASAAMVCLEWWSYEFLILFSGLLPNPQLETSVLSICLQTVSSIYSLPLAIGAAGSTRVSNELGAGNSRAAHIAVYAAMSLAVIETLVVSTSLFFGRHIFGYVFSNEKATVDYVATLAPLVSISLILDGLQGVLSGIARGCGWQHIGAYINLGAFYLLGIPLAAVLAFWLHLKGVGLWVGIQSGALLQTVLLAVVTGCTSWEDQVREARKRMSLGNPQAEEEQLLSRN